MRDIIEMFTEGLRLKEFYKYFSATLWIVIAIAIAWGWHFPLWLAVVMALYLALHDFHAALVDRLEYWESK